MFEEYFKEEYGRDCLKNEHGFMVYKIVGKECFVADFYVKPESRTTYAGKKLFTELCKIALSKGCEFVSAYVSTEPGNLERQKKAQKLLRCHLSVGFVPVSALNDQIVLFYYL